MSRLAGARPRRLPYLRTESTARAVSSWRSDMKLLNRRLLALTLLSSGTLFATGCSTAEAIITTIRLALNIVDVWV